jgi:hypothetical protein
MASQKERFGSHPVYCQTASGYCCKAKELLGYHPLFYSLRAAEIT